jgi:uncharacterized repeat protein (TIGR01451 family)
MRLRSILGLTVLMLAAIATPAVAEGPAVQFTNVPIVGVPSLGGNDCPGGEIYDDGGAENGYSGNPGLVSNYQATQQFTPASYPFAYNTVCVGLVSLGGPNLDFNIQVLDDDGPAGGPGTPLGSVPVSAAGIPGGLPCAFYAFDISSMGLNIPSGNVWIGVNWNPMTFPSRFLCADESPATPLHPGFVNFNLGGGWQATQTVFPAYRAKLVRAQGAPIVQDADLSILKTGLESPPGTVTFTITVTNNGPADATGVVVTDTLPEPQLTYVSDDCGGTNTPPWTWNVGALLNGASATCNITMTVVTPGPVVNTASVAGNEPDPTAGNDSSIATLSVTGVPPSILEIPTIGTVGFVALLLALAASGFVLLRRRRV